MANIVHSGPLLYLRGKGITAQGYDAPHGFVVLADCQGHGSINRERPGGPQDYTFDSPSTAAGVFLRRTANGRIEWKDEQGRTLKELQTE